MLRNPLDAQIYRRNLEPADDIAPVIKALHEVRLAWGLSVRAVAARMGCRYDTLHHMEAGIKDPSYKQLRRWADALGYDIGLMCKRGD